MRARSLCRLVPAVALLWLSAAGAALPRDKAAVEVGFPLASVSATDTEYGDTTWLIAAPAGGLFSSLTSPGLYAAFQVGDRVSFEPQLGLTHIIEGGDSMTLLSAAGQINLAARSWRERTPYLFVRGGLLVVSGEGDSDTEGVIGGGFGFRVPIRSHAVMRWEGFFNRFIDSDANEIGVRVKLGILF